MLPTDVPGLPPTQRGLYCLDWPCDLHIARDSTLIPRPFHIASFRAPLVIVIAAKTHVGRSRHEKAFRHSVHRAYCHRMAGRLWGRHAGRAASAADVVLDGVAGLLP